MEYFAHTGQPNHQDLVDHLQAVAEEARKNASRFTLSDPVVFAALLHDAGKATKNFQQYMLGTGGPNVVKYNRHQRLSALLAKHEACPKDAVVPYLIDHHHGGLRDYENYQERMRKSESVLKGETYPREDREIRKVWYDQVTQWYEETSEKVLDGFSLRAYTQPDNMGLYLRLLHSCLVDGDWRDTARWENETTFTSEFDRDSATIETLNERSRGEYARMREEAQDHPSPLHPLRDAYYQEAQGHIEDCPGFFTLEMPTGSGKTLTSARFAIEHADYHGMDRVILLMPYLAIIQQNAAVYERLFGPENVIEHHTNFSFERKERELSQTHGDVVADRFIRQFRGAIQDWKSPLVVSTTVQFFESLFAYRNSQLRKIQSIPKSVIVIDEFQTLPIGYSKPIYRALETLVENYGCSVVLSSATSPVKQWVKHNMMPEPTGLVDSDRQYHPTFDRVEYKVRPDRMKWSDIAEEVREHDQCMVVTNLKAGCQLLLNYLRPEIDSDCLFHISSSLCPAHREGIFQEMNRRLDAGEPILLVATSAVEAGVDMDFPRVYKQLSPWDSIKQAAGRCNREGELDSGEVVVFETFEKQVNKADPEFTSLMFETGRLLRKHGPGPELLDAFYEYACRDTSLNKDHLDKKGILALEKRLALRTSGQNFRIIETMTADVVVPWGDTDRIDALLSGRVRPTKDDWRFLQRHCISLWPDQIESLIKLGVVEETNLKLEKWSSDYDQRFGVLLSSFI